MPLSPWNPIPAEFLPFLSEAFLELQTNSQQTQTIEISPGFSVILIGLEESVLISYVGDVTKNLISFILNLSPRNQGHT